jgi:hypothetical protein
MLTIRHINRVAAVAMLGVFTSLALVSQAGETYASARAGKMGTSAACEQARQFAWFKRQLQLTDGDTNPFVQPETPAECLGAQASGADQDFESKSANASRSAPATSEIAQNSIPARRQRTTE